MQPDISGFNLYYQDYKDFATECLSFGNNKVYEEVATNVNSSYHRDEPLIYDFYQYYVGTQDLKWLYASIEFTPPLVDDVMNTHAYPKYLDTCMCNQLQDILDSFATYHSGAYENIMSGDTTTSDISEFESWAQDTFGFCFENSAGTDKITKALMKCREAYNLSNSGEYDLSENKGWDNRSIYTLETLVANNLTKPNSDYTFTTADGTDCFSSCSGVTPSARNSFWGEPSKPNIWNPSGGHESCTNCPDCEDLSNLIDSVLSAESGLAGEDLIQYKNCFLSSICKIRDPYNNSLCSNCDPDGMIAAGSANDSAQYLYRKVWDAFEANFNCLWEQTFYINAYGEIDENGEIVLPTSNLDPKQKIKLLMEEYGNCIELGCSYCYSGGEVNCCKDTTKYFTALVNLLDGFTAEKNALGNQFMPRSPYPAYPDRNDYYSSPLYQGNCYVSINYEIVDNKMPVLHFKFADDCGDEFHVAMTYMNNYENQANYGKILDFVDINLRPDVNGTGCFGTNRFVAHALQSAYTSSGDDTTILVEIAGMISDYYLFSGKWSEDSTCQEGPALCNKKAYILQMSVPDPCVTWKKMRAKSFAKIAYENYLDSIENDFRRRYYNKCMSVDDQLEMTYDNKEYHYTLYYYDQAGNLIQTVPPQGVDLLSSEAEFDQVQDHRNGIGSPLYPGHTLNTIYRYNTLNEVRLQHTPDGDTSKFWYDRLGRMVVSQNAEQKDQSIMNFSYTIYDSIGRISEVGQIASNSVMTKVIAFDSSSLNDWIGTNVKEQITKTWYDIGQFDLSSAGFTQDNLRSRVVTMAYYATDEEEYDHAVHYSYDIHGNVKELVREIVALHDILQGYKKIEYDYDLVSGNVNYVYYQKGEDDQYTHKYSYDADNRIILVETSNDLIHWDMDARYEYYQHGPLRRMELGHLNVQGVDYAYTIHGWLKGVNSTTLDEERDMGQDGHSTGGNESVARDVFGFSLHYYSGDYSPVNEMNASAPEDFFLIDESGSGYASRVPDLYNGNISRMVTSLAKLSNPTIGKAYEYDQLNRISKAMTYSNYSSSTNEWSSDTTADDDYYTSYTYDANGNILSLARNAESARQMDRLTYHYIAGTNQLEYVDDGINKDSFDYDIDDQSAGNYTYDKIGNLISDSSEYIMEIKWTVYGKIKEIIRDTNRTHDKPNLSFEYTPDGHRVAKHVADIDGKVSSTWYIRDASGNIMATYTREDVSALDTLLFSPLDILDELIEDKTIASILTMLDQDLDWTGHVPGVKLDSLITDLVNDDLEVEFLRHFSIVPWLIGEVFDTIAGNAISDTAIISALRYYEVYDAGIFNALCAGCVDSIMVRLFKYDYALVLEKLHDMDAGLFNELVNMYAQDPPPPDPPLTLSEQITAIMNASTEENTVTVLGNSGPGHNCDSYRDIFNQVLMFGSDDSRDMFASLTNFKTCLFSQLSEATIASALEAYLGSEALWTIFESKFADQLDDIIEDIRDSVPQQFLYYAMLEINDYAEMKKVVGQMHGPSIYDWLNAVQSRFGVDYYNQLVDDLMENYSMERWTYKLNEQHIYGSSRLGLEERNLILVETEYHISDYNYITENGDSVMVYDYSGDSIKYILRGDKRYEFSNHLGNVLAVITDRRIQTCGMGEVMYYEAQVVSVTDYYPFGMQISERSWSSDSYRFGFNGMEKDDEVKGSGNSLDFGARIYDSRLMRWMSLDPMFKQYPSFSDYSFAANNPIVFIDVGGRWIKGVIITENGEIILTDKASADTRILYENMSKTPTGMAQFFLMAEADKKIKIKIVQRPVYGDDGARVFGFTVHNLFSAKITISTSLFGRYSNTSELLNGVGVHESVHAIDEEQIQIDNSDQRSTWEGERKPIELEYQSRNEFNNGNSAAYKDIYEIPNPALTDKFNNIKPAYFPTSSYLPDVCSEESIIEDTQATPSADQEIELSPSQDYIWEL